MNEDCRFDRFEFILFLTPADPEQTGCNVRSNSTDRERILIALLHDRLLVLGITFIPYNRLKESVVGPRAYLLMIALHWYQGVFSSIRSCLVTLSVIVLGGGGGGVGAIYCELMSCGRLWRRHTFRHQMIDLVFWLYMRKVRWGD